jgi:hypothetical protein
LSLIPSWVNTFWWPSVTDAFQQFGKSNIEGTAAHFRKMLIDGGKGEKIPKYIIDE